MILDESKTTIYRSGRDHYAAYSELMHLASTHMARMGGGFVMFEFESRKDQYDEEYEYTLLAKHWSHNMDYFMECVVKERNKYKTHKARIVYEEEAGK